MKTDSSERETNAIRRSNAIFKVRLIGLVEALAVLAGLLFVLGLFGRFYWLLDLCSHFRAQYAVGLVLCGAGLLMAGRRKSGIVSLGGGVLLATTFLPLHVLPQPADVNPWKIISFNVNTDNEERQAVRDFLEHEDADMVLLMEVSETWLEELKPLLQRYPYRIEIARDDNFGIALLSKHPFSNQAVRYSGPYHIPWIEAEVNLLGLPVKLVALHPLPPTAKENSDLRNEHLREAADLLGERTGILFGDLNLTPYSPWFTEVLQRGRLVDAGANAGFSPTWARSTPLISIPIDHVLLGPSLAAVSRKVGPSLGSDHNAVIVQIAPAKH